MLEADGGDVIAPLGALESAEASQSSVFHDFEHEIGGKHHEEGETIEVIDKRER